MSVQRRKNPSARRFDFDEVRPNSFVIGAPQLRSLLKGEGDFSGTFFRLRTWRRDGLIARIRERGFSVRTLDERLDDLPPLPPPLPRGQLLQRSISGERGNYSLFDPAALHWQPVEPERQGDNETIALPAGAIVRHRRGRSSASYYQVVGEHGQIGLHALAETTALLQAYAQATAQGLHDIPVQRRPEGYLLPRTTYLPPPHRDLLALLGTATPDGLLLPAESWSLAHKIYQMLRLKPVVRKEKP